MTGKSTIASQFIPLVFMILAVVAVYVTGYVLLGEKWGLRRYPNEYFRVFPDHRLTEAYAPMLHIESVSLGALVTGCERDVLEVRGTCHIVDENRLEWDLFHWERR